MLTPLRVAQNPNTAAAASRSRTDHRASNGARVGDYGPADPGQQSVVILLVVL